MRILVTGANGITGHAVIRHLVARGAEVSGLVSQNSSQAAIADLGATPCVGDLRDDKALRQAMVSAERVYHICPAWVPDEVEIGNVVIDAARDANISLLGYHSTIAPHLEEVPSHWAKMQVQMALMRGGVPFSVIQSAAYMQNITVALNTGKLAQPYRADAPQSWVDVEDVGEAIAILMMRPGQGGGIYELCGTETPLTLQDIAETLSQTLKQEIGALAHPVEEFVLSPPYSDFSPAQLERLKAYFRFIDEFGMCAGNPKVLTMILGRAATSFSAVAARLGYRP